MFAIIGGGIGGLTTALALHQTGYTSTVFEQSPALNEIGAGLQLSPNATRRLIRLGLSDELHQSSTYPEQLSVKDANTSKVLARIPLGQTSLKRYQAPYITIHRGMLHQLLLKKIVQLQHKGYSLQLCLNTKLHTKNLDEYTLNNHCFNHQYAGLIGADGIHSQVRDYVLNKINNPINNNINNHFNKNHYIYRALIPYSDLDTLWKYNEVTAWLGDNFHAVTYPIINMQYQKCLNIVVIFNNNINNTNNISQYKNNINDLINFIPQSAWQLWTSKNYPVLNSHNEMAYKHIALLGDAAHPMRPYMAQGAAMAIEDACVLADSIQHYSDVKEAFKVYAQTRWQRCRQVQCTAEQNGKVFHATGFLKYARNISLSLLNQRLLDNPWLYKY